MKALVAYWLVKADEIEKVILLLCPIMILAIVLVIHFFKKTIEAPLIVCIIVLALFSLSSGIVNGRIIVRAIRFKRAFGFWLPSTEDGLVGLKALVVHVLSKHAEYLDRNCKAEERMSLELRNSDDPKHVLALERNLRQNKRAIRARKKEFYYCRNLAKRMGFETHSSYKDYLYRK